jgi:hypothetical protein
LAVAGVQSIDKLLTDINADDSKSSFGKGDRQRQANISKSNDGHIGLPGFDPVEKIIGCVRLVEHAPPEITVSLLFFKRQHAILLVE